MHIQKNTRFARLEMTKTLQNIDFKVINNNDRNFEESTREYSVEMLMCGELETQHDKVNYIKPIMIGTEGDGFGTGSKLLRSS